LEVVDGKPAHDGAGRLHYQTVGPRAGDRATQDDARLRIARDRHFAGQGGQQRRQGDRVGPGARNIEVDNISRRGQIRGLDRFTERDASDADAVVLIDGRVDGNHCRREDVAVHAAIIARQIQETAVGRDVHVYRTVRIRREASHGVGRNIDDVYPA